MAMKFKETLNVRKHWPSKKYDEIPRWNRDRLWKHNLLAKMMKFQGGIETELWKRNSFGGYDEIPAGIETICGNAIYW